MKSPDGLLELAGQTYGISPTHPASELRRRLLFSRLTSGPLSFVNIFESSTGLQISEASNSAHVPLCPPVDQLFRELRKLYGPEVAAICVGLMPYIEAIADTIFSETRTYLQNGAPELLYEPSNLEFDLTTHLKMVCALVPPIEYRDDKGLHAADLASILNVGWAALLTQLNKMENIAGPFSDPVSSKMERLHELLLRAVELSEARRLWEEHN